jgi:hypothetical protein
VIDLRSSQEVERAARTTGCGPHRSRARRGPRDRESCRLCGRFVDLYSQRAEDPNRVGGTRDALPTFVLLDDRRRSRGGWLIEIPRHQRTFPRTEQERGVWTPSPFPRLAAAPSSPQRRMCREAPSGRTAARTGLRAKSGRNVRSSGSSALTERRQGFRHSPPGPGTLRGRGGQTPLDPLPCGGETRTSSSQSFQQSGCIADQGVGSIVLQPALLRADGSRRRLLWLPRSRSLRRRMRRGAADFSTVLFD